MRDFTRMILAAYPRIPHLIGTMNEVIEQTALRSFYDHAAPCDAAVRLLKKIEKRDALQTLLTVVKKGVESLPKDQKRILSERYFGEGKTYRKDGFAFSKSTYYRRLRRAVQGLESFLAKQGAEECFYGCGLHKTAFFAFLADHLALQRRKKKEGCVAVQRPLQMGDFTLNRPAATGANA